MTTKLVDYDGKKAAAALYGWEICGYSAEITAGTTVLLTRWEDKNDMVIEPPPIILKPDGREFFDTRDGQHQVFLRVPFHDTAEMWLLLLRLDELRRATARKGT